MLLGTYEMNVFSPCISERVCVLVHTDLIVWLGMEFQDEALQHSDGFTPSFLELSISVERVDAGLTASPLLFHLRSFVFFGHSEVSTSKAHVCIYRLMFSCLTAFQERSKPGLAPA